MADDEEIIKRRLLFDGDGTGEERKTNILLRKFYKWCNLDPTTDEGLSACNQVASLLAQCEFSYSKSRCVRQMNEAECNSYEEVKRDMKADIERAVSDCAGRRGELVLANDHRKNSLEYEAIARNIKRHPERKQSLKRLMKLHSDIFQYREKLDKLKQKLDKRRKQVSIVLNSLNQLSHSVESGDLELAGGVAEPPLHLTRSNKLPGASDHRRNKKSQDSSKS